MNLLGLVFSILLILSFGYYSLAEKHLTGNKLRNSYISHSRVHRKICNQFTSELYNNLQGVKTERKKTNKKKNAGPKNIIVEPNRECAKLNLWPLIEEGRENHPKLYELAIKLIGTFYKPLGDGEKRFEHRFLDQFIQCAKSVKKEEFSLETLSFSDPEMQKLYYKMLKGTKKWDLNNHIGYPPLLDYVKANPSIEAICVFHSHPDMLQILFNPKIGQALYSSIHRKEGNSPLSQELIEHFASVTHSFRIDPELYPLLTLSGYLDHVEKRKIFVAAEGEVQIRKNLALK